MGNERSPRLRAIDVRPIVQEGQPFLLLRDPLQLSDKLVLLPQDLGPILLLCDGTRTMKELQTILLLHFGLRIGMDALEQVCNALDGALLLENERFARTYAAAVDAYRSAPFRPPVLAGQSYPDDEQELRHLLDGYLEAADEAPAADGVRGIVCPHIDYARGGAVYARVWARAAESVRAADLVVLLGTDHYGGDGRLTLTRQSYATPFGVLPTDREVVDQLVEALGEEAAFADELHHHTEHSIELAAVWLHHLLDGQAVPLVPILCGSFSHFVEGVADPRQTPEFERLVEVLQRVMSDHNVLIVAAADLAHVGPAFGGDPQGLAERARLQAADDVLIEHICAGDAEAFFAAIRHEGNHFGVCGLPPIYLTLRALGSSGGERVAYAWCPADEQEASLVSVCGVLLY
jgi:hypothetical protein